MPELQDIYGMVSVDEEDVPFSNIIYPADAKGMVSLRTRITTNRHTPKYIYTKFQIRMIH